MKQKQIETYLELERRIHADYDNLTEKTKIVAQYCLEHPDLVALETVTEIANNLGISVSNVMRFSNQMGFSGFSEMQKIFRKRLLGNALGYRERLLEPSDDMRENFSPTLPAKDLLTHLVNEDILNLRKMAKELDGQRLEEVANALADADMVWLAGLGRSKSFINSVYYSLSKFGIRCRCFTYEADSYLREAEMIRPGEVVMLTSFHPYREEPKQIAEIVRSNGIPLIVLTDSKLNFYSSRASTLVHVNDSKIKGFRTFTATMLVCQALCMRAGAILAERDSRAMQNL